MELDQYLTAGLVLVSCSLIYLWRSKNNKLPPGPWGLPILGYYPFLSKTPHEDYERLSKKYGNIFSFRTVGGKLIVVLNGFKLVKEVLVTRSDEFGGRIPENNMIWWMSDGLGVTQEEGHPWKEQRRFFLQSAKNFGFGKLELQDRIHDEIRLLLIEFRKFEGKPINIGNHVAHTTNSVISHVLFSKRLKKEDPAFKEMCKGFDDLLDMFLHCSGLLVGWFFENIVMNFYSGASKGAQGKKNIAKIVNKFVEDHVQSFDPNHPRDFVDSYLEQRSKLEKSRELEKSSFTMERLKANAMNMFIEGTESVKTTTCCLLEELSLHPEIQSKMQQELDAVVGRERLPSWLDKQQLPYLDAVIQELYRKAAPFTFTTMYSNYEETTIQGYRIPKRSAIISSLWSVHNDPELFENPSEFIPERYLDSEGKRVKKEGPFPFGLGIAQEEGAPWRDQRRFFLQSVKSFGFGKQSFESNIQEDIKLMLADLRKTNGRPIDLTLYLSHTTNSVISQILFNRKQDKNDKLFQEMCLGLDSMVHMFAAGHVVAVGWFYDYIVMNFVPGSAKAKMGKKIISKIVDEIIDDHVRTFDPEHIRDFVDDYLLQRSKLQKSGELAKSTFTLPRLRAIALNMFFEGTESTSAAIKGFLGELSKHESDQKRAQEEIDSVVGKERLPSWLDKPNLPFLDSLVLELNRTTMPFNTSTLYSNYKETTIQGHRIPKRSIVLASLWSMNNDPELFKNPSRFDPRRFLGPDGKRIKQDGPFTFGVGKRACIGESLAQMEVFLFIACILQAFTLHPADAEASLVKLIPRE